MNIYTVSHRSEYTPHIFVNILLYIFMWQHWRNDTTMLPLYIKIYNKIFTKMWLTSLTYIYIHTFILAFGFYFSTIVPGSHTHSEIKMFHNFCKNSAFSLICQCSPFMWPTWTWWEKGVGKSFTLLHGFLLERLHFVHGNVIAALLVFCWKSFNSLNIVVWVSISFLISKLWFTPSYWNQYIFSTLWLNSSVLAPICFTCTQATRCLQQHLCCAEWMSERVVNP